MGVESVVRQRMKVLDVCVITSLLCSLEDVDDVVAGVVENPFPDGRGQSKLFCFLS